MIKSATTVPRFNTVYYRSWIGLGIAVVILIVYTRFVTNSATNNLDPVIDSVTIRNNQTIDISSIESSLLSNKTAITTTEDLENDDDINNTLPTTNIILSSSVIRSDLHLVYFGNSILYVNDCPGVIRKMIEVSTISNIANEPETKIVEQEACLIGGATLTTLWDEKKCEFLNRYVDKTNDPEDDAEYASFYPNVHHTWDYVIMNDQTQAPARNWSRSYSSFTIRTRYGPLFLRNDNFRHRPTIPIIIQTAAYLKEGVQYSDDLGTFDEYTNKLADGVREYQTMFNKVFFDTLQVTSDDKKQLYGARIAPVGEVYRYLRNNDYTLYEKLYSTDNYHPSPYGTWVQACIVFITCFQQPPPHFQPSFVNQPYGLPTDEAETLRQAACHITGITC